MSNRFYKGKLSQSIAAENISVREIGLMMAGNNVSNHCMNADP
ncbi:MAG: hypothetical protein WCA35_05390 [Kovacikia sp.]